MAGNLHGAKDNSLVFGLLLIPKRIARPITEQLEGTSFVKLKPEAAAHVLEGVFYLQWIKAGVVVGICGLVAFALRDVSGVLADAAVWIISVAMGWLPMYMIMLFWPLLALRRSTNVDQSIEGAHPAVSRFVRLVPLVALIAAVLLAFVIPLR